MARLLHRLGALTARHPGRTIGLWAVLLIAAIIGGLTAGGTYVSTLTIPGTKAQVLADRLQDELPAAAGGSGTITFTSDKPLTDEQKAGISAALTKVKDVPGVSSVVDPFELTAQTDEQIAAMEAAPAQFEAGEKQITDNEAQLNAGQTQLDEKKAELEAGKTQLADQKAQLEAAEAAIPAELRDVPASQLPPQVAAQLAQLEEGKAQIAAAEAQLADGEAQIAEAQKQIDDGRAQLEEGKTQLAEQKAQFEAGKATLELAGDYSVVSEDQTTALGMVSFDEPDMSISEETKSGVKEATADALPAGVTAYYSQTIDTELPEVFGPTEALGLGIAVITLLVMLRSVFAAALPLVTGLVGVGITVMSASILASIVDMHSISPILGIMLGLAVGLDYTLFVVHRHREQIKRGMDVKESIALAIGTSGNAVLFAGSTVVIALIALNLVGIPFLGILGNVAALAVILAVALSLTLTPALLSLLGYKVLGRKHRESSKGKTEVEAAHASYEGKPDPLPTRHPWLTTIVTVALLGALAIPFFSMRLGLPDGATEQPGTPAHEGYVLMSEKFGPGRNGPLLVVADLPEGLSQAEQQKLTLDVAQQITTTDGIVSIVPVGTSESGTMAAYQVISAEGPSALETEQLVTDLRDASPLTVDGHEVTTGVTGMAAMQIDISEKLSEALPIYLGVVIAISLVLLILVFRSILVPLVATLGFLASIIAAMGAVVAVYQWGHLSAIFQTENTGPILSFLPTLLIGILFGLAMDYQLFLATGMREAWVHGRPAKRAVVEGLYAGRRVVIAAAIIMFSVFAGFIFAHMSMVRPLGFGLAIGVLLDAFVVRMALMPALMTILGEKAWWLPAWLDKALPNVDVEGSSLVDSTDADAPATSDHPQSTEPRSRGRHSRTQN